MRARADTAHVRRIGGGAATGLGLVIAKDKEAVGAGLELRAHQGLIRIRITPRADIVSCANLDIVKGSNGLVVIPCIPRI